MLKSNYHPKKLVAISRYQNYFPTLPTDIQREVCDRIGELTEEERQFCDKGNYKHMAQILTSIALYEVLQKHGKTEEEAYKIVSEKMWKFLDPSGMQKLAKELLSAFNEKDRAARLQEGIGLWLALHLAQGRPEA